MSEKIHRTICALAGGGAMIYFGLVTQEQAITEFIDFNTLGLLTGMMILISVVKQSGFFQVLALWALKKSKGSPRELLILLSIVTAVGAALIDSVTAAPPVARRAAAESVAEGASGADGGRRGASPRRRGQAGGKRGKLRKSGERCAGPGAEMPIRGLRYIRGETSRSASPNVRRHAAGRHVSRAIRRHEARSSS